MYLLPAIKVGSKANITGSKNQWPFSSPLVICNGSCQIEDQQYLSKIGFFFREINFFTEFSGINILLPTFYAPNLGEVKGPGHIGFGPSVHSSVTLWQLGNSRTANARIIIFHQIIRFGFFVKIHLLESSKLELYCCRVCSEEVIHTF